MSENILIIDLVEPYVGWYLDEENAISSNGVNYETRPLGINPMAKEILTGIPRDAILPIDASRVKGHKFSLLFILSHGNVGERPIVIDALGKFNADILRDYNNLANIRRAELTASDTKAMDMKLDKEKVAEEFLTTAKLFKGSRDRNRFGRGDSDE